MNEIDQIQDQIRKLQQHVTEQDTEMFRLSKRLDSMIRRLEKLEKRLGSAQSDSPIESDAANADERPPHY